MAGDETAIALMSEVSSDPCYFSKTGEWVAYDNVICARD